MAKSLKEANGMVEHLIATKLKQHGVVVSFERIQGEPRGVCARACGRCCALLLLLRITGNGRKPSQPPSHILCMLWIRVIAQCTRQRL